MAPGRNTRQPQKARSVVHSSRVLRSGNRPVVEDVPQNDDYRAVVGRAPAVTTRRHPITGRVGRRTSNAAVQSRELPFLSHWASPFSRGVQLMFPSPPIHRDPRSSRRGVLEVERRDNLPRMATGERRFPQRSNRAAVLDRINVSVNGTRARRVPNNRTIGDVGAIGTPIGGAVMRRRPNAHLATLRYAHIMNAMPGRAHLARFFGPFNSDENSPLPRLLGRPVVIERRTQRRNIGYGPNQVTSRLDTIFSGGDMLEIHDLLARNGSPEVGFFDLLRRVIHEEEVRLDYPPNQLFNPNADPFETPDPLTKRLGNSGGQCTICYEDDCADAVYCMHCYQQIGCFGCLIKWVQTNSVEVEPGVRYVSNRDHLSCPLCRHLWETARPEVFRNTEKTPSPRSIPEVNTNIARDNYLMTPTSGGESHCFSPNRVSPIQYFHENDNLINDSIKNDCNIIYSMLYDVPFRKWSDDAFNLADIDVDCDTWQRKMAQCRTDIIKEFELDESLRIYISHLRDCITKNSHLKTAKIAGFELKKYTETHRLLNKARNLWIQQLLFNISKISEEEFERFAQKALTFEFEGIDKVSLRDFIALVRREYMIVKRLNTLAPSGINKIRLKSEGGTSTTFLAADLTSLDEGPERFNFTLQYPMLSEKPSTSTKPTPEKPKKLNIFRRIVNTLCCFKKTK
uniref:RING-type domain-containing protein n=1 Tax=Rhabditophanes sp. KR3021 TaxID=114890 RepID=A0AC35U8W9_9BILA